MLEFLSDPEWIQPQIDFLIQLQNIRTNCSDILDKFFLSVTIFGEFWLPTVICAIVYWCIDFKAGLYLFSLESFNKLFAYLFKMLACVYRPWILDSRIHPTPLAIHNAGSYSFPSGHSAMSSSVLGGCAFLLRHKIWSTILVCLVLLVGFSRLWLGVHTPQDVICGLSIGFCLVFIIYPLINWAEKNPDRYIWLLLVIDILAILILVYLHFFNTYRMDYIEGKLLVDPLRIKYKTLIYYAESLGIINGCFLCARFFPFNPKDATLKNRIARGIVGSIGIVILLNFVFEYIKSSVKIYYAVPLSFLIGITITLIYPIIFTKLKKL